MQELIMIKYAELTTKKDNRGYFVKILKQNIMDALKGINYELSSRAIQTVYTLCSEMDNKLIEKQLLNPIITASIQEENI